VTLRTITFDDEQWQVVPRRLQGEMIDMLQGYIDADGDAVSAWADTLGEAPEPETCYCDEKGIGDPKQSCGDCPRDYGIPTVRANPEPPAQQPINQCDGCRRGLPVDEHGVHRGKGYDMIDCTAHLYQAPAQQPITDDTQRLDHLIQTGAFRVFSADISGNHVWTGVGRPIGEGATVRDAIDDSIKRHHGIGKGESDD